MEADYNWEKAGEYLVNVDIYDTHKDKVFHATITMWISKKNKSPEFSGLFLSYF